MPVGIAPTEDAVSRRFAASRRARAAILKQVLSLQRIAPGVRQPFAHRHASQEEVYVVVEGGGRVKLGDEIVDLALWDAARARPVWRSFEGGADGMTFVVFGAPAMDDPRAESEPERDWWTD